MDYEKKLAAIEFYEKHPEYKPFIGDKYDDYKILHIGESHYIGQKASDSNEQFPISYFDQWWTDPCEKLRSQKDSDPRWGTWGQWYDTRYVVTNYLNGCRGRSHGIFSETIKVFDKVILDRPNVHINDEESQNYHYFAFMNFFQMPSLYKGMKFWNALETSAKKLDDPGKANATWETAVAVSSTVLDQVIDILEPKIIIFTSKSAKGAYNGTHKDDENIICSTHPGCAWWNRKDKEGYTGRDKLERALAAVYKK